MTFTGVLMARESNMSEYGTKSSDYRAERWLEEEPDNLRTEFQRDVGRILYSNAFRRLRTKTQVFTDPDDPHNRTRLTHSLEVSQIARQISRLLKLNEDLTEAISLGHDLGHTPFGHAGEDALNKMCEKIGGFSHNAQGVWIVEKGFHMQKINGRYIPGLNLTYAVREGILKHTDVTTNKDEYKRFHIDKPATPEGQVVDLADGIAYLYHDIEDGIRNKLLDQREVNNYWNKQLDINDGKWLRHLINDVVKNSTGNSIISFSPEVKKAYKGMKKYIIENLIESDKVKKADEKGYQLICELYYLLIEHPELLPKSIQNENKIRDFGIERAIIDYIQWLGDQHVERTLRSLKKKAGIVS